MRTAPNHRTESHALGRHLKAAVLAVGVGCLWIPAAPAAYASDCYIEEMTHNGSTVLFEQCDGGITISYAKPRATIAVEGAKTGSLLLRGKVSSSGAVTGTATTFKAGCPDEFFLVSGTANFDKGSVRSLTVSGDAPVRDTSCSVVSRETVRLVFER